mgnify:CR=1 FL=1
MKRPVGRPRKSDTVRQRQRVSIGMTDEDYAALERHTATLGVTMHEYIRQLVLASLPAQ